jgi:hypothetical protein
VRDRRIQRERERERAREKESEREREREKEREGGIEMTERGVDRGSLRKRERKYR